MERAERRAEGTALAVTPAITILPPTIVASTHRPIIIDVHPGFAREAPRMPRAPASVRPRNRKLRPILLAVALLTAAVGFRGTLVEAVPALGGLYRAIGLPVNLSGIELRDTHATRIYRGGWEQLRVEGTIVSVAGEAVPIPLIEIVLLGSDGREIGVRQAEAIAATIAPGGRIPFAVDFPDLPSGAAEIILRLGDGQTIEVR